MSPADPQLEDIFPWWKEVREKAKKLIWFFHTRRAVLQGEPLWEYSKEALNDKKYLTPWQFNIQQSLLSATPAIIFGYFIKLAYHNESVCVPLDQTNCEIQAGIGSGIQFLLGTNPEAIAFFEKLSGALSALVVPIALALTSYAAASGSLLPDHKTPQSLARARRVYLYWDGAYGLWPQLLIALLWSFQAATGAEPIIILLVAFPIVAWQNTLTLWKIPKGLFALNGYPNAYPASFFVWRKDANDQRWTRYRRVTAATAIALVLLFDVVGQLLIAGASNVLATSHVWLQ